MTEGKANKKKGRKFKNPRHKSTKISLRKFDALLRCFADDKTVNATHVITKLSERSVRDRFAEIRERMFVAVLDEPRLFNGFGYLVTDAYGQMDAHMLQFFAAFSKTSIFKAHMKSRYPRTNPKTQPMLHHLFEFFIRKFVALKPFELKQSETKTKIDTVIRSAEDVNIKALLHQLAKEKYGKDDKRFSLQYHAFLHKQRQVYLPLYSGNAQSSTIFYDLKYLLLKYPI